MVKVELKDGKYWIDGTPRFLYGGTLQYYRVPKKLWGSSLKKLKEANINFIDIYIPWIWHEYEEGKFDFRGETIPERDLIGFVEGVKENGLWLIIRPGPNIYAEYLNFGFPLWLTENHPEIMQVAENGKRWHVVSFNHPLHLRYVSKWYEAVFNALKPYYDIIIGVQIDNETGLLLTDSLLSPTPLLRDYNPSTLEMFREWLKERYGSIQKLNELLHTDYKEWKDFVPRPKLKWYRLRSEVKNFGEMMIWQDFLEDWILAYLDTLKRMMLEYELPFPFTLNEGAIIYAPCNSRKKSRIAPIGYDLYPKVLGTKNAFDLPFLPCYASGLFQNYSGDGPSFSPETGCGWFDPYSRVPLEETVQMAMMEIAHSTRFINYYVLHDCIEADGTPYEWDTCIDVKGEIRPRYEAVKAVGSFIKSNEEVLLKSEEIKDEIAIGEYLPNHRMFSSDPFHHLMDFAVHGFFGLLHEIGINPPIIDLEEETDLKKYKAIYMLSKGYMDEETFNKIKKWASDGGNLIVSPYPITKDLHGNPLDNIFPAELKKRKIYYFTRSCLYFLLNLLIWRIKRVKIKSKWQLFTIDGMQQTIPGLGSFLGKGVKLSYEKGNVMGSPVVCFWKLGKNTTPILRKGRKVAGYLAKYGKGSIILLGTPMGASLACGAYYKLSEREIKENQNFARWLVEKCGISPVLSTSANIEVTARRYENGILLFLINRGFAKTGNFRILNSKILPEGEKYKLRKLFSYHKSALFKEEATREELGSGIGYRMDKDDVLVVDLSL